MRKWIRLPGPGQFRGEGDWVEIGESAEDLEAWRIHRETGFLPTAEQEEKPEA